MISLSAILVAIAKLFGVGALGFGAVRLGLLQSRTLTALSRLVIYFTLPCLIVDTYARVLDPSVLPSLVLCFTAGAFLIAAAILVAFAASALLPAKGGKDRGLFVSLASMQNSGYLPIPLVVAILPGEPQARGLLYTFMYIFVMSFVFWSLGIRLISGSGTERFRDHVKRAVNPPLVSLLAGFVFLSPAVKDAYGSLAAVPILVSVFGQSTIPIVLLVLGGSLAARNEPEDGGTAEVLASAFVKLLLIPAAVLVILKVFPLDPVFGFALLLQATMPAATNHIVIVREYGGNQALTSRALLAHYLAAVVTVPLFLWLF